MVILRRPPPPWLCRRDHPGEVVGATRRSRINFLDMHQYHDKWSLQQNGGKIFTLPEYLLEFLVVVLSCLFLGCVSRDVGYFYKTRTVEGNALRRGWMVIDRAFECALGLMNEMLDGGGKRGLEFLQVKSLSVKIGKL